MKKIIISLLLLSSILSAQQKNEQSNYQSLLSSPLISVTISGAFAVNGTYPAGVNERLDQFITRITDEIRSRSSAISIQQQSSFNELSRTSLRNIIIKHFSGEETKVDLLRFRLLADYSNNPYLQKNDVIIFSKPDESKDFIRVYGDVNFPLEFEYKDGDDLTTAINFAQGARGNISRVEISGGKNNSLRVLNSNELSKKINLMKGNEIKVVVQSLADVESHEQLSENFVGIQQFGVTIGGDFIVNGTFPGFPNERVDQFISRIYNETKTSILGATKDNITLRETQEKLDNYSLRGIKLVRKSGRLIWVDLMKFRVTGDFSLNPILENNDLLIFPAYDIKNNFVDIAGAVNKPVVFPFIEGDQLQDAIELAQGINNAYSNVDYAEISRLDNTTNTENIISVGITEEFNLRRGDRITLKGNFLERKNYKALVLGEVMNPGFVYITKDSTTIFDVLNLAGGVKESAQLSRAELLRGNNPSELLRKEKIFQEWSNKGSYKSFLSQSELSMQIDSASITSLSNVYPENDVNFDVDNFLRRFDSKSSVDFSKIFETGSDESKFIVKDGDIILIPEKFNFIYVFGQIRNVGFLEYKSGAAFEYYIQKAGGLSEFAEDLDEAAIIKGKTKEWIIDDKDDAKIEPGDLIYVPKEPYRNFTFYLNRIGNIAGIIGAVATVILLFSKL